MTYGIQLGQWNAVFAVPSSVVDEHMKLAGAAQLKVLLYLLRHAGKAVTLDELAFAVGQKTADTQDAVDYWISCGVLSDGGDYLQPPAAPAPSEAAKEAAPDVSGQPSAVPLPTASVRNALGQTAQAPLPVRDKMRYPFDECMKFVAEDTSLRNMLTAVESLLGKQLTHTEVTCFVSLVKWHGLPCTIVPMLIQYCRTIGKTSLSYLESTGVGWAAEEIDTFEKAEQKIAAQTARRKAWNTVRTALEIPERKATETEMKYSDLWINGQKMEAELVRHAYDKCIDKHGKINFPYMNGILKRYYEQGITDVASALKRDEQQRAEHESRRASKQSSGGTSDGRYGETYAAQDIEAILDAEWLSENVGSDGDYHYDD